MDNYIKQIIQEKKSVYFVSPHFDDAVLSCGGLIAYLAPRTDVTVITVFTEAGGEKETLSAKQAVKFSGFPSAAALYAARQREDKIALRLLGVRGKQLGEVEALWRQKRTQSKLVSLLGAILPEFSHIYPTYRFHIASGKIAARDQETITRISRKLKRLIPQDAVVFAPLGIGSHIDHLVTREAAKRFQTLMYWYDQPYYYREFGSKPPQNGKKAYEFTERSGKKHEAAAQYKTQIPLLFSEKQMPVLREFFTFG